MNAVSPEILRTIQELQRLPSLAAFALGGGTNLALQYNHRISDDIDLFCPHIVGLKGFATIQSEVAAFYGDRAQRFDDPCAIDDQFSFLRFFIEIEEGTVLKVELLQNMKNLYEIETSNGVRLLSKKDIGLFKLVSAANRSSQKDIYDLDFITNDIPLVTLYDALVLKIKTYDGTGDRTIFDLDEHQSPIGRPELLLKFDSVPGSGKLPSHTSDHLHIVPGNKTWQLSKIEWRTKVRRLYEHLGKDFPRPEGMPIK